MQHLNRLREALADRCLVEDEPGRGVMRCVYRGCDLHHAFSPATCAPRDFVVTP